MNKDVSCDTGEAIKMEEARKACLTESTQEAVRKSRKILSCISIKQNKLR